MAKRKPVQVPRSLADQAAASRAASGHSVGSARKHKDQQEAL